MNTTGNPTEERQPVKTQTENLPALSRLIQELFRENEKNLSRLKGISRKIRLLYNLLDPEQELEKILTQNNKNIEDVLDSVVLLVRILLHDCESGEREKLEFQETVADLEAESEEQEKEKERLELVNAELEMENTALKRELKTRRNRGKRKVKRKR